MKSYILGEFPDLKTHVHFHHFWSICDSNLKSQGLPSYLAKPMSSRAVFAADSENESGQEWIRRAGPSPALGPRTLSLQVCRLPPPSPASSPENWVQLTEHLSALLWGPVAWDHLKCWPLMWLQLLCRSAWEVHSSRGEGRGPGSRQSSQQAL